MLLRALALLPFALLAFMPGTARADRGQKHVFVHVSSPRVVRLEQRAAERSPWESACDSPCDRELPLAAEYRVVYAKDAAPGDPFRLHDSPDDEVELRVDMPSNGERIAGRVVTGVGVVAAVVGVIGVVSFGIAASRTPNEAACHDGDDPSAHRDGGIACGLGEGIAAGLAVISGVFALVGGGLIIGGLGITRDGDGHAKQQEPSPRLDAFVRRPTWVGPNLATASRPPMFVPLSFSF